MSAVENCQLLDPVLDELMRLEEDEAAHRRAWPIKHFKPRPSAAPFFASTKTVFFMFGGNGSSKSWSLLGRIVQAMTGLESIHCPGTLVDMPKPPFLVRYYCPDLVRTAKEVVLPFLEQWVPASLVDTRRGGSPPGFNSETNTYHLLNGCRMQLMSYLTPHPGSEAAAPAIVGLDEPPPESIYEAAWGRVIRTGGFIWGSMTLLAEDQVRCPYPVAWIDRRIRRRGDGEHVDWCELSTEENIVATAEEKGGDVGRRMLERLQQAKISLSEDQYATRVMGKPGWLSTIIFKEFSEPVHVYDYPGIKQEHFIQLAEADYGTFYACMDHGINHPTVVGYIYVARRPVPALRIAEGDCILVGEYYRRRATVVQHLPALQFNHLRYRPAEYWCDPHMWNRDAAVGGLTVAQMYQEPRLLKEILAGTRYDVPIDTSVSVGPMRMGNNKTDVGIQMVSALLTPRSEPTPWPGLRILRNGAPMFQRAFQEWSEKPDAMLRTGEDKFSEHMKDPMDSTRYFATARIGAGDDIPTLATVPHDRLTGIGLDDFCSLRGAY